MNTCNPHAELTTILANITDPYDWKELCRNSIAVWLGGLVEFNCDITNEANMLGELASITSERIKATLILD